MLLLADELHALGGEPLDEFQQIARIAGKMADAFHEHLSPA